MRARAAYVMTVLTVASVYSLREKHSVLWIYQTLYSLGGRRIAIQVHYYRVGCHLDAKVISRKQTDLPEPSEDAEGGGGVGLKG